MTNLVKYRKQRTYFIVVYIERHPYPCDYFVEPRWSIHHRRLDKKFKTVEEAKAAIVELVNTTTYPLQKIAIRTVATIEVVSDHLGKNFCE